MAKLAPACTALSARAAVLALLLCMAGSVYLLQSELPQELAQLHDGALHNERESQSSMLRAGNGIAAAGLFPRRRNARTKCWGSPDRASCEGELDEEGKEVTEVEEVKDVRKVNEGGLKEGLAETGQLPAGQNGISAPPENGRETRAGRKTGQGATVGGQKQGAARLRLRESGRKGRKANVSTTSAHQRRAQTVAAEVAESNAGFSQKLAGERVSLEGGGCTTLGRAEEQLEREGRRDASLESGSGVGGSTTVGRTKEQLERRTQKDASPEPNLREDASTEPDLRKSASAEPAGKSSSGKGKRELQAQVQQCIVQRGGGLRAEVVPGDFCKIRIMHPPGVAVTWVSGPSRQSPPCGTEGCRLAPTRFAI